MSDQSNILASKKKLTLSGITEGQKDALIGGGLSLTALVAGVGFYKLFGANNTHSMSSFTEESESDSPESFESEVVNNETVEEVYSEAAEVVEPLDFSSAAEEELVTFSFYSDAQISTAAEDYMSFDEAFSVARDDVGAGGFFNYQGQSYSTFYEEEWNGMSSENQNSFLDQVNELSDYQNGFVIDSEVYSEIIEEPSEYQVEFVNEEEVVEIDSDLISEDDFFSDLDESVEEEPPSETNTTEQEEPNLFEEDDFFGDLENTSEDDSSEQVGGDENVILVRPVYGMDANDDQVMDMIAIDANEDGIADVIAIDDDFDGDFETYMINEDGGSNLDVMVIDEGLDGVDPSDSKSEIDDVVSMEDFIIMDNDDAITIEDIEVIDGLRGEFNEVGLNENQNNTQDDADSFDEDFDEIGL